MQDFELLRNVTIGQYIPTDSVVHRLDPRAKIVAALLLALAISSTRSILASAILIGFLLITAWVARISPVYVLRGLLPGLGFIIFLFVMQPMVSPQGLSQRVLASITCTPAYSARACMPSR